MTPGFILWSVTKGLMGNITQLNYTFSSENVELKWKSSEREGVKYRYKQKVLN